MGIHVLSNFINTNDPYVTPVPDPRLMRTGSASIKAIDATQTIIEVGSGPYFKKQASNHLRTVRIGKELIQYDSATQEPPYLLLGCKRGAFGTKASAHSSMEQADKLIDHDYGVFFPNIDMQKEVAINFANLLNETGVDHFDFDGFEGGVGTGEGDYGVELFAKEIYDRVKHPVIYGTSISKSYFWHICSYYNWGEPWYGGFNESMQYKKVKLVRYSLCPCVSYLHPKRVSCYCIFDGKKGEETNTEERRKRYETRMFECAKRKGR